MAPHLVKWQKRFGPDGLVVIEIEDGTADTLAQVREWAANGKVLYPVLYDAEGAMSKLYGITSFPSSYLIGRDGVVAWEGGGWGGEEGIAAYDAAIGKALAGL
jgi:hypothetical protein